MVHLLPLQSLLQSSPSPLQSSPSRFPSPLQSSLSLFPRLMTRRMSQWLAQRL